MDNEKKDRLAELEQKLTLKTRNGSQLIWLTYNPNADFDYDISNAEEEVRWMIFEIKRLREENDHFREFIDSYNIQMKKELGIPGDSED
ncbi:hypothetical protein [Oceanispirochaeta sp.]|uniref:hypothetical protein n=1 Tax=Oceanispirochaeta sp. TaxID=2035350 RepID=UPI0026345625|nr:hypothetical protein [Oceanispirochaeta sp.]MDA3955159.1 hypothetical protein [Oceanispirochaeta sp.]